MKEVVLTALMAGCLTVCFYQNPSFAGEGKSSAEGANPCQKILQHLSSMRECPAGSDCIGIRARIAVVEEEKGSQYCRLFGQVSEVPEGFESGKFEGVRDNGTESLSDLLLRDTPSNKAVSFLYQIKDVNRFASYDYFTFSYPHLKSKLKKRIYFSDIAYSWQDLKKRLSDKIAVAHTGSEGCRAVWFNCSCLRPGDGGENTFGFGTGGDDLGQCTSMDWLNWHYINNPREACAERWNPSNPDATIYQEDVKCNVCWRCLEYCTLK